MGLNLWGERLIEEMVVFQGRLRGWSKFGSEVRDDCRWSVAVERVDDNSCGREKGGRRATWMEF